MRWCTLEGGMFAMVYLRGRDVCNGVPWKEGCLQWCTLEGGMFAMVYLRGRDVCNGVP